jgi:hypothetical protein
MYATVTMTDGFVHRIPKLLGGPASNAKIRKNRGCVSRYLAMLPHKLGGHGNLCPHASPGCIDLCLNISGMSYGNWGAAHMILRGRLARTRLYFEQRDVFMAMWHIEMQAAMRQCQRENLPLYLRPNLISDLDWWRKHPEMFSPYLGPTLKMIDYTKDVKKYQRFVDGKYMPGYHLTFSRSEKNEADCVRFLSQGGTVAAVFDTTYSHAHHYYAPLPRTWKGFPVIDGDINDQRYLDPQGVVVGLRAKGKARRPEARDSGFVVQTDQCKVNPQVLQEVC